MLITRMFDAVTYPLIGYLSDRSYVRSGTRRNWTIAGTLLSMLGTWFLLRPPQNVSVLYFGIWTAVLYVGRSEEHTSELQSLMRISYAVFCLKKKKRTDTPQNYYYTIIKIMTCRVI